MVRRLSALLLVCACTTRRPAPALRIDGRLDEPAWRAPARSGAFRDAHGGEAVPYSDARFLVDDDWLYIALYASDEDIRSDDAFTIVLGADRYTFTAAGVMTPRPAGAAVAVDREGTLDQPGDSDEEWVIEARLPRPHGRVRARIERCDRGRCGSAEMTFAL